MFKKIPKEIREEIIEKIKLGEKVSNLSTQYGISLNTSLKNNSCFICFYVNRIMSSKNGYLTVIV